MSFQVPRYWAWARREMEARRGRSTFPMDLIKYGWSDVSAEEAQRKAERALEELASRVMSGEELSHYNYGDRYPLREELIQEVRVHGEVTAYVTRNSYGCLVLNSAQVLFADIDCPKRKPAGGLLRRLFGGTKDNAPDPADEALARVGEWARQNSRYSFRAYRTNAGLRLLFTSHLFDPTAAATRQLLEDLGSDALYVRLCRAQECFRARLTPKPWRIGWKSAHHHWPPLSPTHEAEMAKWQREYEKRRPRFAVCALAQEFGRGEVLEEVRPILALHDEMTGVGQALPLA